MSDEQEPRKITQRGLYFEEFEEGAVYVHAPGRTVTEADNIWFSTATCNPAAIHIDYEYCRNTDFGKPLVNSLFTLGMNVYYRMTDAAATGDAVEPAAAPAPAADAGTVP